MSDQSEFVIAKDRARYIQSLPRNAGQMEFTGNIKMGQSKPTLLPNPANPNLMDSALETPFTAEFWEKRSYDRRRRRAWYTVHTAYQVTERGSHHDRRD